MASRQEGDTVETWAMVKHGYVELRFYINGRRISQSRFDDLYLPVSELARLASGVAAATGKGSA